MSLELEQTKFGFVWGPATVERICDGDFGVVIAVRGRGKEAVYVRISRGGRVVEAVDEKSAREEK